MMRSVVLILAVMLTVAGGTRAYARGNDPGFDAARLASAIVYPVDAVLAGVQGRVLMRVLLRADGSASMIEWQQGNDTLLAGSAFRALVDFRFRAPGRDADPETGWLYIPIEFSFAPASPSSDSAGRAIINVTPAIGRSNDAPELSPFSLRLPYDARGEDTLLPTVSFAELRKHLYYPDMARFRRLEGTVLVHALVDRKGRVTAAYPVLSDNTIFDAAAVEAIKKASFSAGTVHGRSTMLWTVVPVRFQLNRR